MTLDQRNVNNYLIMGNQGENARLTVFGRNGQPAQGVVWANPDTKELMTVADYRAMGYKIVEPKQVCTLDGGTFTPDEGKDFGVMFELDKKADRIVTKGGMVLMYADEATRARLKAQQQAVANLYAKTTGKGEKVRGGADKGGADLETEQQIQVQSLLSD